MGHVDPVYALCQTRASFFIWRANRARKPRPGETESNAGMKAQAHSGKLERPRSCELDTMDASRRVFDADVAKPLQTLQSLEATASRPLSAE